MRATPRLREADSPRIDAYRGRAGIGEHVNVDEAGRTPRATNRLLELDAVHTEEVISDEPSEHLPREAELGHPIEGRTLLPDRHERRPSVVCNRGPGRGL